MDRRAVIVFVVWEVLCLVLIVLAVTGHLHTTPNP
jgi:hypothetical protein